MYAIEPIGIIQSPYKEKFAVPRQPRLVPAASARVKLSGATNSPEAVRGIEQFSHLWLLFLFDQNLDAGWKPTVRPPRLGGNERVGVFASRSTFRPNGIGMSAVELKGVSKQGEQIYLELGSVDLVDGTPIIDIKPYIPYSDSIPEAQGGYAEQAPEQALVQFSNQAEQTLQKRATGAHEREVIAQVLAQDPRPAYKKSRADEKQYAVNLFDLNVKFIVTDKLVTVTSIERF
ncbi:tRNA (N6-threonylcarbamoyladenosine(37)-N6)-methyltransferase TrmO [Vibrio navarrensis]|uniref:tRNA (N6-threonylcarbamoyladenosine(37)-N6)-methyltransferase TrmO n=1 Tax=Vibrio navarrensis TaxID=29495 RepID=UPI0018677663|nr:tRNA (N6-threonylcarbamoyladenosine(37)-N6)-methyltransferase TrmO [Vibrio navarrensis]MBE3665253.1 tRNA (N6-threonylcarbamoyladenosine(37)-N6)-methyltransferase TrmO [Vibrio navarrensis]MBE4573877.1 tRNA (N6-threonylcarbamoyladenosine(37)-N6)-methyltransferase TrmO [Vibrio navarrensis]MBE4578117.1 tRNA (N6-threonylcarbamoyladenosine(37)-N6)-methyltransferase TrmO [Vibrio navarrensis]MBE4585196.1 tRNA (N6-threonylcarbamoyladenosine(37)-N6)-methyltransferase TrmO [Vibrio navarrensis]MBE45967